MGCFCASESVVYYWCFVYTGCLNRNIYILVLRIVYCEGFLVMGVIRFTKSGQGVMFVSDDGQVYLTSKKYLLGFLYGAMKGDFVVLTRLPNNVSPDRFPVSKVLGGKEIVEAGSTSTDALAEKKGKDKVDLVGKEVADW